MKARRGITILTTSLSLVVAIGAGSLAAQEQGANTPNQRDRTEIQPAGAHPSPATQDECTNAPNNADQGAVENAQRSNPNAPVDIQGTRGQTNPSIERAESAQIAENEDNCLDGHEAPRTNENASEPNSPDAKQQ